MSLDVHRRVQSQARTPRRSRRCRMVGLSVVAALAIPVPTLAQDAAKVDAGRQVWASAGCSICHGATGQGGTDLDFPVGPSLRSTELDRTDLVEITSCGRPGTQMPAWLKGAYTEVGCFGLAPGPAPARTMIVGAFDADQIEALVDYILAGFPAR